MVGVLHKVGDDPDHVCEEAGLWMAEALLLASLRVSLAGPASHDEVNRAILQNVRWLQEADVRRQSLHVGEGMLCDLIRKAGFHVRAAFQEEVSS